MAAPARAKRVLIVYGTRPEVIKLAPVVRAVQAHPALEAIVVNTGQHRELTDQAQRVFDLEPGIDLGLMRPSQSLDALAAGVLTAMHGVLVEVRPDVVVVQGDTTTAMAAALAGFHAGAQVAHVEAGLRSGDLALPFPEEANRRVVDSFAEYLFAPTRRAAAALAAEGHEADRIVLTGNTVVDALHIVADDARDENAGSGASLGDEISHEAVPRQDEVLITMHRRESQGEAMREIFRAIATLAGRYPHIRWIFPVHPNPAVRAATRETLADISNVELTEPFDYPELVAQLRRSRLVLTDSGGIQEEAPTFGTPVLVLRDVTERPEGIEAGVARLVGTDPNVVMAETARLLDDRVAWQAMSQAISPYGDGQAARRIADVLASR